MFGQVRFVARGIASYLAFTVVLLYCVVRVLTQHRRRGASSIARDTARLMARLVCPAAGVQVRVVGGAAMETAQPAVYVANHQSFLDYPVLATMFPDRTAVVGKAEIRRIPVVGWLFRKTGNVLLERRDSRRANDTITELVHITRHRGTSIWMFPEGTRRRRRDIDMLPFRTGAFRLAQRAGVPVVPVVVSSLAPRIDVARWHAERATIVVTVLAPRYVPGDADVRQSADETRAEMIEAYRHASWEALREAERKPTA